MDALSADASLDYGATPAVRIVAGDAHLRGLAEAAVAAVGARALIGDAASLSGADALLIELSEGLHERQLDAIREDTADKSRIIVTFPCSLLDVVTASIDRPGVQLLCDPDRAERVVALALALAPRRSRVGEEGDDNGERLRRLSQDVARIARALIEIADSEPRPPRRGPREPERGYRGEDPPRVDATEVRRAIRLRRLRDQYFEPALFSDPAWDILLDLMGARLEHQRVAVSSLCIAAAVPTTTALRWIRAMTEQGLLVRTADPHDARRMFVALSDDAAAAMARYFAAARSMA